MIKRLNLILVLFSVLGLAACGDPVQSNGANYQVNVQPASVSASEGLDLQAVGELAKQAKTAAELEAMLNKPGGVNNLDLDQDGSVDYIRVTEYGSGNTRGFSLTADLGNGQEQEIATINIEKTADGANVQLQGNTQIYGNNQYYYSHWTLTDFLILNYLFSPYHTVYVSPYHYGYYPGYYSPYRAVPVTTYRTYTRTVTRTSTIQKVQSPKITSSATSPNANKSAASIKAPSRNPAASQTSFKERDTNKSVGTGGFGNNSAKNQQSRQTTQSSPAPRPSSPSRPSGGGGRRR